MQIVNDFTALSPVSETSRWNAGLSEGTPVAISFSFVRQVNEFPDVSQFQGAEITNFTTGFEDAGKQASVRNAIAVVEAIAGIRFVEVDAGGMIQFVEAASVDLDGAAMPPVVTTSSAQASYVVLAQNGLPAATGTDDFRVLLRELGRALGLSDPETGDLALDPGLVSVDQTVMATGLAGGASELGALDGQALAAVYGGATAFGLDTLSLTFDGVNGEIDIAGVGAAARFVAPNFATNIQMSTGDDVVFGNADSDRIDGGAGADELFGGAGDDVLIGGDGADILDGLGLVEGDADGGADQLFGGDGDDRLTFRPGGALYDGGAGSDLLYAFHMTQASIDLTDGSLFVSVEHALLTRGDDMFQGAAASEFVRGAAGDDVLFGGDGDDLLNGGPGADDMQGGAGDDSFWVDDAGDLVADFDGADEVFAWVDYTLPGAIENGVAMGEVTLSGNAGANSLSGDGAGNRLLGLDGDDILNGRDGDDTLEGGAGSDRIFGAPGADTILGGDGDDVLDGGAGADDMRGGAGDDVYRVDDPADLIDEASGVDTVIASADYALPSGVENGVAIGAVAVAGNADANALSGDGAANRLSGLDGDDVLMGRAGDDTLEGGAGADRLVGGAGADTMTGGAGDDIYEVRDSGDVVVELPGGGVDRINVFVDYVNPAGVEFLVGKFAAGALVLTGGAQDERLVGSDLAGASDTLDGGDGVDRLAGLAGDDELFGGGGDDRLFGGSGDDVIHGGPGADGMSGEEGSDRFVHEPGDGADEVNDFSVTSDILDLSAHAFALLALALATASDLAEGVRFDFGGGDSILLLGVSKLDLDADVLLL